MAKHSLKPGRVVLWRRGLSEVSTWPQCAIKSVKTVIEARQEAVRRFSRCTCSHGHERERAFRINGCISGDCTHLSLQSAYPAGTQHFLSGPKPNSPPGKTDHPAKCEVRASARLKRS